jgi:hypothetical protein
VSGDPLNAIDYGQYERPHCARCGSQSCTTVVTDGLPCHPRGPWAVPLTVGPVSSGSITSCDVPYDWEGIVKRYPVLTQPYAPPRLSDEDVERVARRVVELMREAKP